MMRRFGTPCAIFAAYVGTAMQLPALVPSLHAEEAASVRALSPLDYRLHNARANAHRAQQPIFQAAPRMTMQATPAPPLETMMRATPQARSGAKQLLNASIRPPDTAQVVAPMMPSGQVMLPASGGI